MTETHFIDRLRFLIILVYGRMASSTVEANPTRGKPTQHLSQHFVLGPKDPHHILNAKISQELDIPFPCYKHSLIKKKLTINAESSQ